MNNLKKPLNNQQGLSLVQVMIAGAMMIGIAVTALKMQETQRKAIKGATQSSEATSVYTLISGILRGTSACTNTFTQANANLVANMPSMGNSVLFNQANILDSEGRVIFESGKKYGSITFKGLQVFNDSNTGIDLSASPTPSSGILIASVLFERDQATGGKQFGRQLTLYVDLDAAGNFSACYDLNTGDIETIMKKVCLGVGATWGDPDDLTATGGANGPEPEQCIPGSFIWDNPVNQQAMCESLGFYWDNSEMKCNKYIRGAHYGGCSKELLVDTTYKGTYNQVWPVLDCSTNPPTCDVGFKSVQLAGGLVNVTPFGELRAEMSSIWETWACAKE